MSATPTRPGNTEGRAEIIARDWPPLNIGCSRPRDRRRRPTTTCVNGRLRLLQTNRHRVREDRRETETSGITPVELESATENEQPHL